MYININSLTTHSEQDIRTLYPNTSFPSPFTPPEGYAYVFPSPPQYDPKLQIATETTPIQTSKGHWEQAWVITDKSAEQLAAEAASQAIADAQLIESKRASLWAAADKYTSNYISGVAVGLLTMGVMQQKPKALAVTAWSSSIWDAYYQRKALITPTSIDDHDFSSFGPIPHSVPELRAELGL